MNYDDVLFGVAVGAPTAMIATIVVKGCIDSSIKRLNWQIKVDREIQRLSDTLRLFTKKENRQ